MYLHEQYRVDFQRFCRLVKVARSVFYSRARKDPQLALRKRLKELAASRPRYGYRRLHAMLPREGWEINHKRGCITSTFRKGYK
jgi:putative transposase